MQKGSTESSLLDDHGTESDEEQKVGCFASEDAPALAKRGGLRRKLYENSLLLVMTTIFFATWLGQSVNNWRVFNENRASNDASTVTWGSYLLDPDFWEKTLQNWQSEFLAVGTMVVFTIYLRQRGSPESKPVGAPNDETASSG